MVLRDADVGSFSGTMEVLLWLSRLSMSTSKSETRSYSGSFDLGRFDAEIRTEDRLAKRIERLLRNS